MDGLITQGASCPLIVGIQNYDGNNTKCAFICTIQSWNRNCIRHTFNYTTYYFDVNSEKSIGDHMNKVIKVRDIVPLCKLNVKIDVIIQKYINNQVIHSSHQYLNSTFIPEELEDKKVDWIEMVNRNHLAMFISGVNHGK